MIPLNQIKVAAPCRQSWDEMNGDAQKRFCQSCRQNVYNISEMSRAEAEKLIREKEGHLCVRFYRRTDGTVMTKDCPVGLRALRLRAAAAFSGLVTMIFGGVGIAKHGSAAPQALMGAPMAAAEPNNTPQAIQGGYSGTHTATQHSTASHATMGKIAMPRPVTQSTTPKGTLLTTPHQEILGEISAPMRQNPVAKPQAILGHIRPIISGHAKHTQQKNRRKISPK